MSSSVVRRISQLGLQVPNCSLMPQGPSKLTKSIQGKAIELQQLEEIALEADNRQSRLASQSKRKAFL